MSRMVLLSLLISASCSSIVQASASNSLNGGRFLRGDRKVPAWFERMENEDETGLMRTCAKRSPKPPVSGNRCGREEKLCYFGTQNCKSVGAHPKIKCHCDGMYGIQEWSCEDESCPSVESPKTTTATPELTTTFTTQVVETTTESPKQKTTTETVEVTTTTETSKAPTTTETSEATTMLVSTVETATTDFFEQTTTNASNEETTTIDMIQETSTPIESETTTLAVMDATTTTMAPPPKPETTLENIVSKAPIDSPSEAVCPEKSPLDAGMGPCSKEEDKLSCSYGTETCCGKTNTNHMCQCDANFGWGCFFTDACMVPECQYTDWSDLKGKSCKEATSAIALKYPGMTVLCQKKSEPNPKEDDHNRYVVYTDDNGVITSVVFNRYAECPATISPFLFCTVPSQECLYTEETSTDSELCTTTTTCTCSSSSSMFECAESAECVPQANALSPEKSSVSPVGMIPSIPEDTQDTSTISAPGGLPFAPGMIPFISEDTQDTSTISAPGGLPFAPGMIPFIQEDTQDTSTISAPGGLPFAPGMIPFIPEDPQAEAVTISAPFKGTEYTPFPSAAPSTSS